MSTEQIATGATGATAETLVVAGKRRLSRRRFYAIAIVAVIALDIVGFLLFPPFPRGGQPGDGCAFPVCYITSTLEFPTPHTVWVLSGDAPSTDQIGFQVSVSSTLLTLWIVAIVLLAVLVPIARQRREVPGRFQNFLEWAWESLRDFGVSLGGPAAVRYVPIFAAFFLLILFSNWAGLVPPVGKVEALRAPTSDVNVTVGFALVAFSMFHIEGFRRLGFKGYLGKFFPFGEFRNGFSAGLIAMFVGLVELLLEFVKPLTLSMRLFGNIYGGEVALGVLTALTLAVIPVLMLALEFMLNTIQALIFSVLTLMFILAAIESHHEESKKGHETPDAGELAGHHPLAAVAH